jgi:hypothetical protein
MTAPTFETIVELPCHGCGYDLRAHPEEGKCPECGALVAESRRLAAIPRRPAWRDSDPRWRRRILAGAWILVLVPLPSVFDFRGTVRTLEDTLVTFPGVYEPLVFCIGVVLLFSKERDRRGNRLDWTRRWGVLSSYVVFLLSAVQVLFIAALVLAGIAAVFQSIALRYQPGATQLFGQVSWAYLRYGAYPKDISVVVLAAFSSITILLACVPLFEALRSSAPKAVAAILVVPLALFALMHLAQIFSERVGVSGMTPMQAFSLAVYFRPQLLVRQIAGLSTSGIAPDTRYGDFLMEAAKWCIVVGIAVWLSFAQLAARRGKKSHAG